MRFNNTARRPQKAFLFSVLIVNGLLFFAYRVPNNSYFSEHDFLDHLYVLYKLRGESPHFFDYSATLNGVLGSIPLSALGISDFSLDANMYVLFDAPIAAVLNEFISRNIAFIGMYFFLQKLMPKPTSNYVVSVPALLFAMLPYYPNFGFTIAFLPIIAYVVLASFSERLSFLRIALIFLASLFGNFTYGGFAVLTTIFILFLVKITRREFQCSVRMLTIFLVLTSGYLVGISRILFLKFATDFHSHRLSWSPMTDNWFDPARLPELTAEMISISFRGYYHFPSGQSLFTNFFLPGMPLVLLAIYLFGQSISFVHKSSKFAFGTKESRLVSCLLGAIFSINLFYSSEASGFTHFEHLIQEPFQFKRVAILLPFFWCVLAGLLLNSTVRIFPKSGVVFFLFVLGQISLSNIGIQQQILNYAGIQNNYLTIKEYSESDAYSKLAQKLGRHPSDIRVLSFELDPMIASLNGYTALDGYVYNYPLDYKNSFREVISGELASDRSLSEYYDDWGSRVYLFHRNLPVKEIQIDWCAAENLGAEFILTKRDLSTVPNLRLTTNYRNLSLYKISGC